MALMVTALFCNPNPDVIIGEYEFDWFDSDAQRVWVEQTNNALRAGQIATIYRSDIDDEAMGEQRVH
jgi:hypothetical protein